MLTGAELHEQVPPNRWCVTKKDLRRFSEAVSRAILEETILPTQQDNFDPDDGACGPNLYTVTDQLIKPKTHEAGDMSWALMLHPQGLQCDLFVSHAWLEGVFELINNLFNGWPYSLKHAWCCALAMPQNLDISMLIADPAKSPFAIALRSASHVVVVSNSKIGIYSRLWCVYEAFLAYELDKSILVGHAPLKQDVYKAIFWKVLLAILLFCLSLAVPSEIANAGGTSQGLFLLTCICQVSIFFGGSMWWVICNVTGLAATSLAVGLEVRRRTPLFEALVDEIWDCNCSAPFLYKLVAIITGALLMVFWLLSSVDRIKYDSLDVVSYQLTRGYTGTVQDASCTNESDKKNIFDAIGPHIKEVDHAVELLITTGMSTGSLRRADELGVNMVGATRFLWAGVFLWFALAFASVPVELTYCEWNATRALSLAASLWIAGWLLTYASLRIDQKTFMVAATTKMSLFTLALRLILVFQARDVTHTRLTNLRYAWWLQQHLGFLLVCSISMAGIDRVASWPLCGPCIAKLIVARTVRDAMYATTSPCTETDTDVSEDEHEDDNSSGSNGP